MNTKTAAPVQGFDPLQTRASVELAIKPDEFHYDQGSGTLILELPAGPQLDFDSLVLQMRGNLPERVLDETLDEVAHVVYTAFALEAIKNRLLKR